MQCKDIPDAPILYGLLKNPGWHCHYEPTEPEIMPTVRSYMPPLPHNAGRLARAKMAMLKRRGLVDGCDCGCRGDWEITDKGIDWVNFRRIRSVVVADLL